MLGAAQMFVYFTSVNREQLANKRTVPVPTANTATTQALHLALHSDF